MDHQNDIYISVAINAWLVLMGVLLLLGAMGKGPFRTTYEQFPIITSKRYKVVVGLGSVLLGSIWLTAYWQSVT